MKFISNAKYGEPVENGTIFKFNACRMDIIVHRIHSLDGWYLSCYRLCINDKPLKSESLMSAIKESKDIIRTELDRINQVKKFFDEEVEISRY